MWEIFRDRLFEEVMARHGRAERVATQRREEEEFRRRYGWPSPPRVVTPSPRRRGGLGQPRGDGNRESSVCVCVCVCVSRITIP